MPRVPRRPGFDARRGPTTWLRPGYSVRLPLLPGHGTRWQDANRTTFDDWLAEVTREFQELTSTCRAVVVCGLSMGGTLTLRLAELYPDAMAGIVLVNPSVLTLRRDAKWLLPWLRYVSPAYPGIIGDIAKPGVVEPGYKYIPTKAAYSLSRAWPVVRAGICRRSPRRCCCCTRRSITPLNR